MAMGEVEGGEEAAFREESAAAIDDLSDLHQQAGRTFPEPSARKASV